VGRTAATRLVSYVAGRWAIIVFFRTETPAQK